LLLVSFFLSSSAASRTPPSFPTRRSSDLLTRHLARFPGAALIVSHDRELLNEACQRIVHLQDGKLFSYEGGYDSFERQLAEKQRLDLKLHAKQEAERRRLQEFVDRFKAKATKAREAHSRVKMLEKMQTIA